MRRSPALPLVVAWLALLALLGVNLTLAYLPLGAGSPAIALGVAAVQIAIVAVALMKLGRTAPLTRIFAAAGLFWLLILFGLSGVDYATRPAPGALDAQAHAGAGQD
jgi:cytochrome c oxidase subunit 4